ncbi:hypothetical protein VE00_02240 [Pseudogymnoascus sp. WSF 3629]|nr:hypothetical protein VE00_02240 [Pseudogymnoascus sp. WSF 3629]
MRAPSTLAVLAAAAAAVVEAQQGPYSQCGGTAWLGPTTCVSGLKCVVLKKGFYQCLPDSFPGPTPTLTTTTPPAATLGPNLLWIRAISPPNFHKYLQSSSPSSPGAAILGPPPAPANSPSPTVDLFFWARRRSFAPSSTPPSSVPARAAWQSPSRPAGLSTEGLSIVVIHFYFGKTADV